MTRATRVHPAHVLATLLALAATVVGGTACPARRDGLSRDALEKADGLKDGQEPLPTIAELLTARVPAAPDAPTTLRGTQPEQAFARGLAIPDGDDADIELLRCLRADARREYGAIARHCGRFSGLCDDDRCVGAAPPADLRAAITTALLARHLGSFDDDTRRRLLPLATGSVARCQEKRGVSACVHHAVAARQLLQGLADALATEEARLAVRASDADWIAFAEVDGPWLDAEAHFVDEPGQTRPLHRHPAFRARRLEAKEGRLRPAEDAQPGWYRLTIQGESAATAAALVLSGHGAVEVRVDGVPVIVRHGGDGGAAVEIVPLQLAAGGHDLEILFFDRGRGLSVAMLGDDGRPALKVVPTRRWRSPAGVTLRPAPGLRALALPPTIDRADAAILPTLLLRHLGARLGLALDRAEQQRTTTALIGRFGWSPVAATAGALGVEADILPDQTRRALSLPIWAGVEASWPESPLPILARARAAADDEPEAALAISRALVERSPAYPIGWREHVGLLLDRGLVDEALTAAERVLAFGHTAENLDAALPAFRAAGALGVIATLTEERLRRADASARHRRRLQQGETASVLQDVVRDGVLDDEREPVIDLLEIVEPELAGRFLEARSQKRPDDVGLALRLARLRDDPATARALTRRTAHVQAWLLARDLGVEPPWSAALADGDRAVAARRAGPPPFPEAAAVTLLQSTERHFAADGTALTIRHFLFEVRSKESIDAVGELQRDDDDLFIRLRVIKPDGRELEPEHHAEVKDISLTGLGPGDLVEWIVVAVDDGARDGAFWETVSLTAPTPTVLRRYRATWPATLEALRSVVAVSDNGAPPGQRTRRGDHVELSFEAADIPALLDEPHAAPRADDEPQVGIVIDVDDDLYRGLRAERRRVALVKDPWLEATAVRLAGRGTPRERLERLHRFVAHRVVEAGAPAEPPSTLATGRGQRLPLIFALARAAGLDARLLAVHSPLEAGVRTPSGRGFAITVVAVAVQAPGAPPEQAVVVAYDGGLLLDRLPSALRDAQTIDVGDGARGVLPASAIDDAPLEVITDLALHQEADGQTTLRGLAVVRLPAPIADPLRATVRGATPEQLERFVEGIFAGSLPGVVASRVSMPGLDALGAGFGFVADLVVPLDVTGPVRFEHLFAGGAAATLRAAPPLASYARVSDRQRTLMVAPWQERIEMTWRLPRTASVVELPPSVDLRAGPFWLKQQAAVDDGVVRWERQLTAGLERVPPPAWPEVRAALAPLMTASDARLIFVVATP